ncbi:MAG: hypothetical protein C0404_06110 [Verrucomicrobia bacterium]|nr:hypothetical protein [Verrucomicrobiota bacterium]
MRWDILRLKSCLRFAAAGSLYLAITAGLLQAADGGPIPPREAIRPDHPRVLLRPSATNVAVSLEQLKGIPRDDEFVRMLEQLRGQKSAAAQAMVWLLTGEKAAADAGVALMLGYKAPDDINSFKVYFGLRELALAYDWLHAYEGFSAESRARVRRNAAPLVDAGLRISDDHVFHNYVWLSAGGLALWAMATAGEDEASDRTYDAIRNRLNTRLLPGLEYLDGAPGESMWYWALYDLSPAALSVLAAQSASERDIFGELKSGYGDSLARQFTHTLICTFPDLGYTPFGDTKTGADVNTSGPDGSVTHEMAGVLCGMSWALKSGEGAWFDRWIAGKRGLRRFYGETAIFYFIYARNQRAAAIAPPLAFLAGNRRGGHLLARSGWDDAATVVALRATDHFGDHNHFDQGSFIVYRNGMLAVDQRIYKKVAGPQQASETHNTLLINGKGQRPVRGQNFRTVQEFEASLAAGARLETGDIISCQDTNDWTAVSAQIAQAYPDGLVKSCIRQMLYLRPGTVVIVDRLQAPEGRQLGEIRWLLHVPKGATVEGGTLMASNAKSFLRCRQLLPGRAVPEKSEALMPSCERYAFPVRGESSLVLVHAMEIGDGSPGVEQADVKARLVDGSVELKTGNRVFVLGSGGSCLEGSALRGAGPQP